MNPQIVRVDIPPTPAPTEHDIRALGEAVKRCYATLSENPDEPDALYEILCLSIGYVEIFPDENGLMTDSGWGLGFDEDGDLVHVPDSLPEVSA